MLIGSTPGAKAFSAGRMAALQARFDADAAVEIDFDDPGEPMLTGLMPWGNPGCRKAEAHIEEDRT